MTKRLFWLGVGIAVGVLVVRKVTKTAESYSPKGLAKSGRDSAIGLVDSVRAFVEDARVAMAEREVDLIRALEQGETPGTNGGAHRAP